MSATGFWTFVMLAAVAGYFGMAVVIAIGGGSTSGRCCGDWVTGRERIKAAPNSHLPATKGEYTGS